MQPSLRHQAIIAIVAGVVFFTNLGVPRLWDRDEPRNAGCAAEMWGRGDWVIPTFNSELRTHKPALLYWLMMSAYSIFGVNEFSARLWSALLGVVTCLLTYQIGRRLYSPRTGLWAGIVLATTLNFGVAARAATPDSVFVFSVTFVLWLFVRGLFPSANESPQEKGDILWQHPTLTTYIWAYLAMGVAVLAKGPIGILLPGGTAGLFLLYATYTTHRGKGELVPDDQKGGGWKSLTLSVLRPFAPWHVIRTIWAMRPFLAMGLVALVALPWYIAVGWKTSGDFLSGFIGTHNVGRFLNPMEGHNGPIFYYLVVILIGFFPWSVFMGPMLHALGGRIRSHHRWYYSDLFVVCWAVVVIGVFSLAATKLPSYVLPAYPAMALLTAAFLDRLSIGEYMLGRRWMQASYAWLLVAGVGLIVGCSVAAKMFLPGEWMIATIGLVPLTGGVVCLWLLRKNQLHRSLTVFAASAVVLATGMFGFCAVRIDQYQVSQPLMNLVHENGIKGARIGAYGGFEPSWGFYAHKPIAELSKGEQLLEYLNSEGDSYVITNDEALEQLEVSLPAEIYILARAPRFLKKGELLILGRPHEAAHWPEVTRISTPSRSAAATTYIVDREGNVDPQGQNKPKRLQR